MSLRGFGGGNNTIDDLNYMSFKEDYAAGTVYDEKDVVEYAGGWYICLISCRGVTPTDTTYWRPFKTAGAATEPKVVGETPVGAINGSNATFTTAYNFDPDTLELFANGIRQQVGTHYTTSGTTTITLGFSPVVGDTVTVNYTIG